MATHYLRIPNIPGDSRTAPFEGWIALESFQQKSGTLQAGGKSVGAQSKLPTSLFFTAMLGRASQKLLQAMVQGRNFEEALVGTPEGKGMHFQLTDVYVASYNVSGSSNLESFELEFKTMKILSDAEFFSLPVFQSAPVAKRR
jgi:type VI protein secretion system component Hcp